MSSQCSADIVEILGVLAVICSIKVGIQEPEYTKDIVAALLEHISTSIILFLVMQVST